MNSTYITIFVYNKESTQQSHSIDLNRFNLYINKTVWNTFQVSRQFNEGSGFYNLNTRVNGVSVYEESSRNVEEVDNLKVYGRKCPDCTHKFYAKKFYIRTGVEFSSD